MVLLFLQRKFLNFRFLSFLFFFRTCMCFVLFASQERASQADTRDFFC